MYKSLVIRLSVSMAVVLFQVAASLDAATPNDRDTFRESAHEAENGAAGSAGTTHRSAVRSSYDTPREWLRLMDFSASEIDSFVDGQPLSDSDNATLLKILYRMPQLSLADVHRWQTVPFNSSRCVRQPNDVRINFFRISGRAKRLRRVELATRLAELLGYDHYFQVEIEPSDMGFQFLICTRMVPRAWLDTAVLDERVAASAMFLKVGQTGNGKTQLVWAAPRIAWFPDRTVPNMQIGPDQVLLGNLAMDVGLLDLLEHRDRLPINSRERECFYQMLATPRRANDSQRQAPAHRLDFTALLQQPQREHGNLFRFSGSLRRITRVLVDEPDIHDRFGITHYFQLDVLVPLHEQTIEMRGVDGESKGPIYQNYFPFTCCIDRLPPSCSAWVKQTQLNEAVTISGFFYKLWSYPNRFVAQYDERQRQLSPMFIVLDLQRPAATPPSSSAWGIFVGSGFLIALVAIWGIIARVTRSDREFARTSLRERFRTRDVEIRDDRDEYRISSKE